MRVLIVDDSVVFRTQISNALSKEPGIEVVGTAAHGRIAIQKLEQNSVDVITLDMEMPEMNGIEVLREIKKRGFPVRVIIFSSQTQKGAVAALEALREGADDVIAKPSGEGLTYENASDAIRTILVPKVLQFSKTIELKSNEASRQESLQRTPLAKPPIAEGGVSSAKRDLSRFFPSVIVIGSSTGGPTALEKIFQIVMAPVAVPIVIAQHMPPVFTEILARRLSDLSGMPAGEAKSGEPLNPNQIYVAPGDFHCLIEGTRAQPRLVLNRAPQRNSVRPAVDYLFESAAAVYGETCLGVVLTGMGEDGLVGAKEIRRRGGSIVIQDKASCVVFGMPGAIFESGDYDQVADLSVIAQQIRRAAKQNLSIAS